mmetsp:Transcript_50348/g.151623  ORF Transcript_50348/g.151623 Transcript_50348/m.151623 type:complete len:116 (-) Transcript_50348:254-601(-)
MFCQKLMLANSGSLYWCRSVQEVYIGGRPGSFGAGASEVGHILSIVDLLDLLSNSRESRPKKLYVFSLLSMQSWHLFSMPIVNIFLSVYIVDHCQDELNAIFACEMDMSCQRVLP